MNLFSFLFQGDLHLANNKKVIPAKEFSKLLKAEAILKKAQQDATHYQKESEKQRKKTLEKATEQGIAEGLLKFNEALLQFEQEVKKIRHESMQAILPLALKAAKKIVGKELEQFPETIVDIVLQTLTPVSQNHRIRIYVNKADKEILEANRPRLKEILEQVEQLLILERDDVNKGGCIIETESGIINADIENQWRALEAAFEKHKKIQ